jgi:myotubularin-related protein 6/7/8
VTLARRGEQVVGTLHLTPHHLIFVHTPPPSDGATAIQAARPRELWITYPIIAFCTLRPAPAASRQPSSIRLRCRDFTFVCFYFANESKARDVYDSIRAWTCKIGRIEKLYAFAYQPQVPEKDVNSWGIYDPMREWRRMGLGDDSRKSNWRISSINSDYVVCFQLSHVDVIITNPPSSPPRTRLSFPCLRRYQTTRSIMLAGTGQEQEYQL